MIGQAIGNALAGVVTGNGRSASHDEDINSDLVQFSDEERAAMLPHPVETVDPSASFAVGGAEAGDSVPIDDVRLENIVVTAERRGGTEGATAPRASAVTGVSLNAAQFADWVKEMNRNGGLQAPPRQANTINSNKGVEQAVARAPADTGGPDTTPPADLDDFMVAISKPLLNLRVSGGSAEKFITVGRNSDGELVVTSVQLAGSQGGGGFWIPTDSVTTAHTHPYDAYQPPHGRDDDYVKVTNKSSYEISAARGNVFELGRYQGSPSIRIIRSPDNFGPWERYQAKPEQYRIYDVKRYPPRQ